MHYFGRSMNVLKARVTDIFGPDTPSAPGRPPPAQVRPGLLLLPPDNIRWPSKSRAHHPRNSDPNATSTTGTRANGYNRFPPLKAPYRVDIVRQRSNDARDSPTIFARRPNPQHRPSPILIMDRNMCGNQRTRIPPNSWGRNGPRHEISRSATGQQGPPRGGPMEIRGGNPKGGGRLKGKRLQSPHSAGPNTLGDSSSI